MTIHDELHRLILRTRWINWSLRNFQPGDYELGGRFFVLSERLSRWKPTWEQRNPNEKFDCE